MKRIYWQLGRRKKIVSIVSNRVLLINPIRIRPVVGPIAFDYLGYALKRAGYTVDLVDHCFQDLKESLAPYLRKKQPLAVGITVRNTDDCYFQSQHSFLDEIKEVIYYIKSFQTAPIILGGVGFSINPKVIMEYCGVDFGVQRDGEDAFPRFLKALQANQEFEQIPNLIFRKNGEIVENPVSYIDLNQFKPPRDLINNQRYFQEGGQGNIETKRGCDQKCIFCADPICKGNVIRLKDPDSVCFEFKALIQQGVNSFHLCDSEFNIPITHAKQVCHAIIENELQNQMTWYTYCAPNPFDEELAHLMKSAGCVGINFGVDSGDDLVLRNLRRTHRARDIIQVVEFCRKNRITVMLDLLVGGPGETPKSIKNTIRLMKELQPDRAGLSIGVRIYPGTELAYMVENDGPLLNNPDIYGVKENNSTFLKPIFYLSSEMGGNSVFSYISQLIGNDPMFFFANPEAKDQNYNYNENQILVDAIKTGFQGAYWDILRKIHND